MVYGVPKEIKDPEGTAFALGAALGLDSGSLSKSLSKSSLLFRLIKEKISADEANKIKTLNLTGVYTGEKEGRLYPFNNLGSRTLGFVGLNDESPEPQGLYGIEKAYEQKLSSGDNIYLSIDRNIQAQAEVKLAELIKNYDAQQGSVVVSEPATGRILAMATLPDFNPNNYSEYSVDYFGNPVVSSVYESGSVFKPLTMAMGIEAGVITPESSFVDNGFVKLNGKTIRNWDLKAHGRVTMTNVIEQSINTGTVFVESKLGHSRFAEFVKKFGFGQKTGIEALDELSGNIRNITKSDGKDIDFATASFGQGTAVTPIQLVKAFGAIANGGLLLKPRLNESAETEVEGRVVSKETAAKVATMMESAVNKAQVAVIPNYRIAGKTGTAQVPDFKRGGYTEQYIHSFVGFGPVSDPKFLVLIKLDKPNVTLAGHTVVPAFRELAEYIISYYHIPPDALPSE